MKMLQLTSNAYLFRLIDICNVLTEEGLVTLECVTSWQTYEKTYVILRELGVGSQLANCFVSFR